MKKLAPLLFLSFFLYPILSLGQGTLAGVNGDCAIGGQQALTQGLASTATQQIGTANTLPGAGVMASFPFCSVTVYFTGTMVKANIFANNLITPTPLGNPFNANTDGSWTFFTAQGSCYDIIISSGTGPILPYSRPYSDVCLGSGSGGGGGSGTVNPGLAQQAAYYGAPGITIFPTSDLTFPGNGIINVSKGINIGSPNQTVKGTATNVAVVALSTGTVNPTVGWATFRFLAGGLYCSVNGGAELICGGGGGSPSSPLKSFQYNSSGTLGGAVGFNYTAGTGINPGQVGADNINNVITVTSDYNFTACPSGPPTCTSTISPTTISAGANTITLTPVPLGINGTNNPHWLKLSGTSCPTQYTLITGGTAVSGAASGTITFTAWAACSINPPTIASATQGMQEAFWSCIFPGCKVQLMPSVNYTITAPMNTLGNDSELDCQEALVLNNSFSSGIVMGAQQNGWGTDSGVEYAMVHNCDIRPVQTLWNVQPTAPSTIPGNSPTATLTITNCPIFPFPGQLLWLDGTFNGVPTSFYGYGEPVLTTGGTCTVGNSGTIIVQQATPDGTGISPTSVNLSTHGTNYHLSNAVAANIEDAAGAHGHIYNVRIQGVAGFGGWGIQVNNDQSCGIDNVSMFDGRADADFQNAGIFSPGPFSGAVGNAAICNVGPNVNFQSQASCVRWYSGNDFSTSGNIVCENFNAGGFTFSNKRGGFGSPVINGNVHFETGGGTHPWTNAVGNPNILAIGGLNKPILNSSSNFQSAFSGGSSAPWPIFLAQGGQTASVYYYLVARNNTITGCTSGGDCFSPPILIGAAQATDPSATPVTVSWYGWGDNTSQPTSYDLLAVSSTSGSIGSSMPQAPVGTGLFAIATGLLPASVCSIQNYCSTTDNIAPGSRSSYTPLTTLASNKRYYPDSFLMPGTVALPGDGSINGSGSTTHAAYIGPSTCVNAMEFLGGRYAAEFPQHSAGSELDVSFNCPFGIAPIAFMGPLSYCVSSAGTCGSSSAGSVTIAAAATTVTVATTAVTPWSHFQISEDMTQGASLGVTCNTTQGRTYSVTTVTPGVSFVITASGAPAANPACLDFKVDNRS